MRVNFYTNVGKSQIRDMGEGIWQIQGIPMTVDNAVMNGIYYPEDENRKGLSSYRNKPVTLRHPEDEGGNPASAREGRALMNHFSGGVIVNTYSRDGINYADAEFKEALLVAQDGGQEYLDKIQNGESIGVSTGLYFDGNNEDGVTANGEEYYATAKGQQGDHLAMLPDNEPPAGGSSTFIRFNGENDDQVMTVNIGEFIENLDASDKEKGLFDKLWKKCKQTFAPLNANSDNSKDLNVNNEGDAMRETLIAALAAKGITVNAEITDAELLAKHTEANTPDVASAINAAVAPLTEKLADMEAKLAENADKELDELAGKAAEHLGVEVAEAKALGVNALHKVLAKHGVPVGTPNATNHESPKAPSESSIDDKPWEAK